MENAAATLPTSQLLVTGAYGSLFYILQPIITSKKKVIASRSYGSQLFTGKCFEAGSILAMVTQALNNTRA